MNYEVKFISSAKIKVPVKVIDKRRKSGFFWDSFYITFRSLVSEFKNRGTDTVFELSATRQNYYDLDVGDIVYVFFYKHSDGKWYQMAES